VIALGSKGRPRGISRSLRARLASCAALAVMGCATTQSNRETESPEVRAEVERMRRIRWEQLANDGEGAATAGDFTRAEQYLAAALQRGAPPERILPRLLRVCINAHRYRAAVEYARPYLAGHEDAWALRFVVASIHVGLNEPLTASRHLELVLRYNPSHAESEFLLGSLLRDDLQNPAAADVHFRRYLELAPDGEHASAARAGVLRRVEEAAAEARQYEQAGGPAVMVMVSADAGAPDGAIPVGNGGADGGVGVVVGRSDAARPR
jgi:tetratricopeptide (TPR) repeat protein